MFTKSFHITSPVHTGSKVGSLYMARSLVFVAPVANNVRDGLMEMAWIPHGQSAGVLSSELRRDGIWVIAFVTVSNIISCKKFHTQDCI